MQKIGKEVKIGLAVIGVLLTTFGYVLVKRLTRPSEASAATVADANHSGDGARPANASDSAPQPTMLSGSSMNRPAIVPVEAKSSRFDDNSARRHVTDGANGDPVAGASDSFMPAQPAGGPADSRVNGPATRDDHVAAAGYGAAGNSSGGYSAANNPAGGYGGAAGASDSPSGASAPGYGAAAAMPSGETNDHHQGRSAEKTGSAVAVDPFQMRRTMAADNSPGAGGSPAPRQLDPSSPAAAAADSPLGRTSSEPAGYGAPLPPPDVADAGNSARGTSPGERRAADRGPLANDGAGAENPYRGKSGLVAVDQNRASLAPVDAPRNDPSAGYSPPASSPYSYQRNGDPAAAPQPLALDASAHKAGQYVVQPNDNYWTISEKVYGTGAYFKAIFEYNRSRHPQADRLQVGEALDTPDATVLQRTYPDLCPKVSRTAAAGRVVPASARMLPGTRVYTVEEGDTLFEIARRELGRPSRWGEIYQLNRDTVGNDFDYLRPGTELLLPADAGATGPHPASMARDPSDAMLR